MAGGATARLRGALEDYISSETGDGGRGNTRSAQAASAQAAVKSAQQLLAGLSGGDQKDIPTAGQRARSRASGGAPTDTAGARARDMLRS